MIRRTDPVIPSQRSENHSTFNTQHSKFKIMKKETWKTVIQIIVSILTAIATTLGVTSCWGTVPV